MILSYGEEENRWRRRIGGEGESAATTNRRVATANWWRVATANRWPWLDLYGEEEVTVEAQLQAVSS
jgi:hypothetical protein